MAREIFYTYSPSGVPADPTANSTKYTAPLAYANGYYKAIAREGGELSTVTSKSFGIAPTDYIAYWSFDGNTNDATGNYNLTNNGATATTGKSGLANTAYSFDGVDDYMASPVMSSISNNKISIFVRLKMASVVSDTKVLMELSNNYNHGNYFLMAIESGNKISFSNHGTGYNIISTVNGIGTDWIDIVITSDRTLSGINETAIYVDKLEVGRILSYEDATTTGNYSASNIYIGGRGTSSCCQCIIDEIKMYNRLLTQDEINTL